MSAPYAPTPTPCDECGAIDESHTQLVSGEHWCDACIDHVATICEACGDACIQDSEPDEWVQVHGEWLCEECHADHMKETAL